MQDMVPILDDLYHKKICNKAEIRQIVQRRREFEYQLQKTDVKPSDFLSYIRYEVAFECLRKRRSQKLNWRKSTVSDFAGIRQIHFIFSRSVSKFKGNVRLWYQYVDFCLRSGSVKQLSKVLFRAVKLHPREVHFWLLAADRALRCGQIQAARTTLLRGIRCMPRSAKLWGQFLHLEIQVACHLLDLRARTDSAKDTEGVAGEAAAPEETAAEASAAAAKGPTEAGAEAQGSASRASPWAPAQLLLRRALARLAASPRACTAFLATAVGCAQKVDPELPTRKGFGELTEDIFKAVADRRPGVIAEAKWAAVDNAAATTLWELWWAQERKQGRPWSAIVEAVAAAAPPAVLQRCAAVLAGLAATEQDAEDPTRALLQLAGATRVVADPDMALAVLEALEHLSASPGASSTATVASRRLLRDAAEAHPSCTRLAALAWQVLPSGERPSCAASILLVVRAARELEASEAAQLLLLAVGAAQEAPSDSPDKTRSTFEELLRTLRKGASPQPLVGAFLGEALSRGAAEFRAACDTVWAVAGQLWEAPETRAQLLAAALDAELRVATPSAAAARRLRDHFEELLTSLQDDAEKVEWWLRYAEFAQRAASWGCGRQLPRPDDLHYRAMRSVPDQAAYSDRMHRRMRLGMS